MDNYKNKYLIYKFKYLNLKQKYYGGSDKITERKSNFKTIKNPIINFKINFLFIMYAC